VWEVAAQIMDLFEHGRLKSQKLNLSTLMSKPQFKQQYFAPIRTLTTSEQISILNQVLNLEITILDLKKVANELKNLNGLKAAFVKLTNSDSWEMAQETHPSFATEIQLKRFLGSNLKICVPKAFEDFCKRAKLSTEPRLQQVESAFTLAGTTYTTNVICSKFTELSGQLILRQQPSFNGSDLAVMKIDNDVS
jgi:hypothetical protein